MKKFIDKALGMLGNKGLVNVFLRGEMWAEKIGLTCLYFVLPVLGIVFSAVYFRGLNRFLGSTNCFRGMHHLLGSGTAIVVAIGFVIACIILGYIADRMLEYVHSSIDHAKTDIVNNAVFDVVAIIFAIVALFSGVATLVSLFLGHIVSMFSALVMFVLSMYFAVMLMSADKMLNVRTLASATPAQSLIAIIALVVKAGYRIIPFAFGAMVLLSVVSGIDMIIVSQHATIPNIMNFVYQLIGAATLPFVAYFVFLAYYFLIDWFCAFFRIASSVEKISESKSKSK